MRKDDTGRALGEQRELLDLQSSVQKERERSMAIVRRSELEDVDDVEPRASGIDTRLDAMLDDRPRRRSAYTPVSVNENQGEEEARLEGKNPRRHH
jgi:hypothetical protein